MLKYKSISNILHLLNTTGSVTHAEPVLASLVVESKSFCKFFSSAILSLIVDSHIHTSRALTRRFLLFVGVPWMKFCYESKMKSWHVTGRHSHDPKAHDHEITLKQIKLHNIEWIYII